MSILYDFLFVDQERMRSLYAQMYEGLLDVMSFDDAKTVRKETSIQVGGDPVGHLGQTSGTEFNQSKIESMVPHDLILKEVLSGLTERGVIVKEHNKLKVGSIALLKGELSLLDTSFFVKALKEIPSLFASSFSVELNQAADNATRSQKRQEKRGHRENQKAGLVEVKALEIMLGTISPLVQLRLSSPAFEAWGAIRAADLRGSIDNLVMQHGYQIPGEWNMLGIVDDIGDAAFFVGNSRPLTGLFEALNTMANALKEFFKRPDDAICVTPLAVYRTLRPK